MDKFVLVLKSGNEVIKIIEPNDISFGEMCRNLMFEGIDQILIMEVEKYEF